MLPKCTAVKAQQELLSTVDLMMLYSRYLLGKPVQIPWHSLKHHATDH
jgi:hypothetical protein